MTEILNRVPHQVDASTFPPISVSQEIGDYDLAIGPVPGQSS